MQFFPIKMTFNDCTLVILTSRLLHEMNDLIYKSEKKLEDFRA